MCGMWNLILEADASGALLYLGRANAGGCLDTTMNISLITGVFGRLGMM